MCNEEPQVFDLEKSEKIHKKMELEKRKEWLEGIIKMSERSFYDVKNNPPIGDIIANSQFKIKLAVLKDRLDQVNKELEELK